MRGVCQSCCCYDIHQETALQADTNVEAYIHRKVDTLPSDGYEPWDLSEECAQERISRACRNRDLTVHEMAKAKRNRAPDARLPAKGTSTQVQNTTDSWVLKQQRRLPPEMQYPRRLYRKSTSW